MASEPTTEPLRNMAGSSKSPYIRRHADSPVAWQPLTQESLDLAAQENKLVFLNIGSAPCHYAQLMSQDSWSRPAVASILNKHYIPIMVDKDERPDLDSIYAHYLMSIHGKAGYPMNLFLTSKLHPVYGDTYLEGPTEHDYDEVGEDNPNIVFILNRVEKHWREERERLLAEGTATFSQLREILAEGTRSQPSAMTNAEGTEELGDDVDIELEIMEEAYTGHAKLYDPVNAGFLSVPTDPTMPEIIPKFSMVSRLDYLLRLSHLPSAVRGVVGDPECETATKMTLETLRKMRDLTMQDHLGGGFHSSTQTRDWAFPLFDKVTGHNGQLLDLYLDAWLTTSNPDDRKDVNLSEIWRSKNNEFLDVVISLATYLTSPPICLPTGGFCTSEAADSVVRGATSGSGSSRQLRVGAFYVWSKKDLFAAIEHGSGGTANGELAASFFNVKGEGNIDKVLDPRDEFIMENVLAIVGDEGQLAGRHGITPVDARNNLSRAKDALRRNRDSHRTRPAADTRVIAGENGKVIGALARAGAALKVVDKDLGEKCLSAASRAAALIKEKMWDAGHKTLYRIYGNEREEIKGFAEDYAFLIDGLIHLYEATGEVKWLRWADELQESQISHFYDPRTPASPSSPEAAPVPSPSTISGDDAATTLGPTSTTTETPDFAHCGGFYSTPPAGPHNIIRTKSAMDDVSPSVNGVSASNLFRLGSLLSDKKYVRLAKETILAFEVEMPVHPGLFTSLLVNLVTAKMGSQGSEWLVVGPGTKGKGKGVEGEKANHANSTEPREDDTKEEGSSIVDPGDLKQTFFSSPRAGMRSLVQLTQGAEWLAERSPRIKAFLESKAEGEALDSGVAYVFDEGKGSYRACAADEFRRFGTDA
ncbi:hypothetical protein MKZ38_006204 [Zalerion maritima]|uniref:Spermatogenesis-associated protein 20-like TRX domain-containing protein n=1 Tax=Zalerion maritima TaxID=339359 RepID=A0AAD5RK96_9PEZI|nr:hypothetical protein MKZ38_006204 [Zalerion maritima]